MTTMLRFFALLFLLAPIPAQLKLGSLFQDHMVLQADKPIRIHGTSAPNGAVRVELAGKHTQVAADDQGVWRAELPALPPGGPYELVVDGNGALVVRDVWLGEVWVCSGQSNMWWPLEQTDQGNEAIAAADHPQIRLFTVPQKTAQAAQTEVAGKWVACSPETVRRFSAVAYWFGRALQKHRKVPIGLIHTSWGGTPAEAWTRPATLAKDPVLQPIVTRWERIVDEWPKAKSAFDERLARWQEAAAAAKAKGEKEPPRPSAPPGPESPHRPGTLFHAMVAPLAGITIRGVIWYQGESNASRAWQYRTLFPAMIRDWREAFGQGDFPFLFVQLASFRPAESARAGWAELREAQLHTLRTVPNTGMAVAIDIGDSKDIHPRNKRDVGERLALAARAVAYGEKVPGSGPLYRDHVREGRGMRVRFDSIGGGLEARGGELKGFWIAGKDLRFVPAQARIDGEGVIVESPDVPEPAAVRYAFEADPVATLYNREGLPASPFRTDETPASTRDAR